MSGLVGKSLVVHEKSVRASFESLKGELWLIDHSNPPNCLSIISLRILLFLLSELETAKNAPSSRFDDALAFFTAKESCAFLACSFWHSCSESLVMAEGAELPQSDDELTIYMCKCMFFIQDWL